MNLQHHHTIVLNFRAVSEKVSSVKLHLWIAQSFKLKLGEVVSIEVQNILKQVFIKLSSETVCNKLLPDYGNEDDFQSNNVNYKIPLDKAESVHTTINIHPVPVEMDQRLLNFKHV